MLIQFTIPLLISDVFQQAYTLADSFIVGISGLIIYNMRSGILHAVGNSRCPAYALIISTNINIGFDLLLVCVFRYGIVGAAIATVAAQFGSACFLISCLIRCPVEYAFRVKKLIIDVPIAAKGLKLGIPVGLQRTITSFSNVVVQSHINYFGSDCMAGWAVYSKVHHLAILPMEDI